MEGNGKIFLFWIQMGKKIYGNSYKSLDINTLLDCSVKFVHLFDSVYQFPFTW